MKKIGYKIIAPQSTDSFSVSIRMKLEKKFKKDISQILLTLLDKRYISGLRYNCEEEDLAALMGIENALHEGCTVEFYGVSD